MIALISNGHPLVEISIKTLVGYLESFNIPVRAVYLNQIGSVSDKVIEQIKELTKDSVFVGFSLMSKDVLELTPLFKALKEVNKTIVWGGIHATALPEESLDTADFVCVGEGEEPIRLLYEKLKNKQLGFDIPNIGYKQNNQKILNQTTFFLNSLDETPYPDYEFKDSFVYLHDKKELIKISLDPIGKQEVLGFDSFLYYSQRGCRFACTYCSNSLYHDLARACQRQWYRLASPARVKAELSRYARLLPFLKGIALNDDDFLARSLEDITEITNFIKSELNLPFTINGIPGYVTEDKVAVMVKNGLTKISFGVQSGSERILHKIYKRPQTNEQVLSAAKICAKFCDQGLSADYGFITDNPYETDDDWRDSLRLIMDLPQPRSISLYSLTFFAGTKLTDMALADGHLKSLSSEFNKLYQEDFSYTYPSCLFFLQSYYHRFVPDKIGYWLMTDSVIRKFYYWPVRWVVITAVKQRVLIKKISQIGQSLKDFIFKVKRKIIYLTTNRLLHLLADPLEKIRNRSHKKLNINNVAKGWSVVIITGAKDLVLLEKVIASVDRELAGSPAEIILVGPPNLQLSQKFKLPIKHLVYRDINILPPLITRKKNLGVSLCVYDKVAVCHDYVVFQPGWLKGWNDFGDDFEVAMNQIKNYEGIRHFDWLVWDYPQLGPGFLPYHAEVSRYQYISGTYFVAKRDFYLANPLNEKLRWGEGEDVEWSKRIRTKIVFKFNQHSTVQLARPKGSINDHITWLANSKLLNKIFENYNYKTND